MRIGSLAYVGYSGINGHANPTGFFIENKDVFVKSKNYRGELAAADIRWEKKHEALRVIITILLVVALLWSIFANESMTLWFKLLLGLILGGLFSVILDHSNGTLITLVFQLQMNKNLKEYHACEHKVVVLLSEKLEPTMENLKRMPRVHSHCGSVVVALSGIAPILAVYSIMMILLSLSLPVALTAVLLLILLPFILQFFCCTAEPSQDKLEEALEVAKQFKLKTLYR